MFQVQDGAPFVCDGAQPPGEDPSLTKVTALLSRPLGPFGPLLEASFLRLRRSWGLCGCAASKSLRLTALEAPGAQMLV